MNILQAGGSFFGTCLDRQPHEGNPFLVHGFTSVALPANYLLVPHFPIKNILRHSYLTGRGGQAFVGWAGILLLSSVCAGSLSQIYAVRRTRVG